MGEGFHQVDAHATVAVRCLAADADARRSCHPSYMAMPPSDSRRYDFPPLWAVPLLLLGAIAVAWYLSLMFGFWGFAVALAVMWWLERKADNYVRTRDSAPTD